MKQIQSITSDANQEFTIVTEDGIKVKCILTYLPTQQMWSISLDDGDFVINNLLLVVSPNILYQFSNNLTYGIAINSIDGQDPFYVEDFAVDRCQFFLLNAQEIQDIKDLINEV